VRQFADATRTYVTLDDAATLAVVRQDPVEFVRSVDRAGIDEVQRVPELLLAIKQSVDLDRRPGRFLLTGSANVMTLPRVADSLAGRIETGRLSPSTAKQPERSLTGLKRCGRERQLAESTRHSSG